MLIKEILDKVNSNYTPLENARMMYIELARKLNFNTTIRNTSRFCYGELYDERIDPENFDDREIICTSWVQLYSFLLNSIGIKNEIINHVHKYIEFYIDDIRWVADATVGDYTDLSKIKNGDYTDYFGIAECQKEKHTNIIRYDESIKVLEEVDKKFDSYIKLVEKNNKLIQTLKKIKNGNIDIKTIIDNYSINKDEEILLKLEYLFKKLGRLNDGYYESKSYVYQLEKQLLTDEELRHVGGVELKRTNRDLTVDLVQCIYIYCNHKFSYYLLKPNLPIIKVNEKDLDILGFYGYGIDDKNIPGIIFNNQFLCCEKSHKNYLGMILYKNSPIYQYSLSQKIKKDNYK